MIGHREELKFIEYEFVPNDEGYVKFKIKLGEKESPFFLLPVKEQVNYLITNDVEIELELGDKLIRIREVENRDKVLLWFTPDKFLFDFSRNYIKVHVDCHFNLRDFTRYELYYVGISLENDSFSRLFEKAHHGRLKILTNEQSKDKKSRLTDELVIFLFDIEKTNINIIEDLRKLDEEINYFTSNEKAIIADAEKAFVKLLDTKYNQVKFKRYPLGEDGLYEEGLDRYAYAISEDITFFTDIAEFNGALDLAEPKDFIFVEGDLSIIMKASSRVDIV